MKLLPTVVAAVAAVSLSCNQTPSAIDIATTTSVVNSGLLEAILPEFRDYAVRVHAAGSGRSLAMLAEQTVALVISHAPAAEQQIIGQHPQWHYRKLAYNEFLIVGPADDPAAVRDAAGVKDAFTRIAQSSAAFISRGDGSGTHERETRLWELAGTTPAGRLLTSGGSMAVTLMQADSQLAYTLTDDATWRQLRGQLDGLVEIFSGDPVLLNTYAVVHRGDDVAAEVLAAWLTEGRGRELIGSYVIGDRPAFRLWPSGCPGDTPAAPVCE